MSTMSRRKFLKTGAIAAAGLTVVPSSVLGQKFGKISPSDKLNIAGVGVGGRGFGVLKALESQNIVGLCGWYSVLRSGCSREDHAVL